MLKLLRRYNKIILVFGGCLLMIVFLVPTVGMPGGGGGMRRGATLARFDGGKMTAGDYMRAQKDLETLTIVRFSDFGGSSISDFMGIESVEHWFLLGHLAEQAGLVGGPQDGRELLTALAEDRSGEAIRMQIQSNPTVPPNEIESMRPMLVQTMLQKFEESRDAALRRGGRTEEDIDRALAKAYGVFRLIMASRADRSLSRPEAVEYARRLFDTVTADIMIVPAASVAGELSPPDEARIAAHFEKFRSVRPSEDPHGIGYRLSPAVKIEFLTVDSNMLRSGVTLDPIEVNKYWRQNRATFPGEFGQERPIVESEFRRREVERLMQRVREGTDSRIKLALSQQARAGSESSGGVTIENVADIIRRQLGGEPSAASPVTVTPSGGQWLEATELSRLPGIPQADWRASDRVTLPFVQVVMSLPELGAPPNPMLASERDRLKVGAPFGPLFDAGGNMYYFRVVEARPEGPAQSIDEFRERILADIAALDGLALLESRADDLRRTLAEQGLGAMLDSNPAHYRSVIDVRITHERLAQERASRVFPELDDPALRSAVIGRASGWDPLSNIADIPALDRIVAVPNSKLRAMVLVQIKSRFPMTQEQLAGNENAVLGLAITNRERLRQELADAPFSFRRLSERLNYRATRGEESEEAPQAETAPAAG